MKIITDNLITSASTTGGELSATNYPIENCLTVFPTQSYIADTTVSPTNNMDITLNISADADGLFLFNWLADAIEVSLNGGSTWNNPDFDFVSDNYFLNQGSNILTKPVFFPTGTTSANGYVVRFRTTTDRKGQPAKGNDIYQFEVDDGATGRFEDSAGGTINIFDHAQVMVGSYVNLGGTIHQITKIIGDGTTTGSITLTGSPSGTTTVTALYNPVKLGVAIAGTIETFENPSVGLQRAFVDYSTRRTSTGGLNSFRQSNAGQIFNGTLVSSVTNSDAFIEFARAIRARPFPILIADGMPSAQYENYNFSLYAQFLEMPDVSYSGQSGDRRNIDFRLKEFL